MNKRMAMIGVVVLGLLAVAASVLARMRCSLSRA